MPKKQSEPKPRPVGRPRSRPEGARFRGLWLTDEEYAAVKGHVTQLRAARAGENRSSHG